MDVEDREAASLLRLQDIDIRFAVERSRHKAIPDGFGIQSICAECYTPWAWSDSSHYKCPGLRTLDRLLEEEESPDGH